MKIIGFVIGFIIAALVAINAVALAQSRTAPKTPRSPPPASGPANAVQGFSTNKNQPIHIEALRLEVRDKSKIATFSGDVQVVQGDTQLRCKILVVFYEPDSALPASGTAAPSSTLNSEQRIRKLEARGGVVVTQKDQIATGDSALFDMRTNTVTLIDNVVVTQGQNVLRGDRLVVDMTTGISRVESGKSGEGRVQGLFLPGSGPIGPGAPGKPDSKPDSPASASPQGARPRPVTRQSPGQPLRLN
jgi:lipopolysaccharide export system protein LptA